MTSSEKLHQLLLDKQLLESAQRIGKLGGWELNLESGELFWTNETYALHDTKPEEFNPTVDAGLGAYLPRSRKVLSEALERAIRHGEGYDLALELKTTKGRQITVRTTCVVSKDSAGKAVKLTGIFQDISERKRLERVVNSYKEALDQHSLVSVAGADGCITFVNDLFVQVSGYSREELLGQNHNILNSGFHGPEFFEQMYALINAGKVWHGKIRNKAKDGRLNWLDMTISPLTDEDGQVREYIAISTDVTDKISAERAIIEGQRLSAMGEMASSIAHDFNNSLQAIIGNLELAKQFPEMTPRALEYFDLIEGIAFNVKDRVQALQRFGSPKRENALVAETCPNLIITEAVAELRPFWKDQNEKLGRSVVINTDLQGKHLIKIHKGDFKNIMYNLIKNGVEALGDRGGWVKIATRSEGERLIIEVSDNGCGMSEETQKRVFDPFFSTKGFEVGRGLGLSGVVRVLKEYDGTMRIAHSALGEGTIFEMSLPVAGVSDQKDIKNPEISLEELQKQPILWVEDDPHIGPTAKILVESLGYSCKWVKSGEEALMELAQENSPFVITDVGMSGMSGLELADIIAESYPETKVAVVSGWQMDEVALHRHNLVGALSKPFNLEQLKSLLLLMQR